MICGLGNTGMNCSWCDGGFEGDTGSCVCACGVVHGGGSGHRLLPPKLGWSPQGEKVALRGSARDPHQEHRWPCRGPWDLLGDSRWHCTVTNMCDAACHCRGHWWQCTVSVGDTRHHAVTTGTSVSVKGAAASHSPGAGALTVGKLRHGKDMI